MHQRLRRCQFCDHTFTGRKRKFCYNCLPAELPTTSPEYSKKYNDLNRACGYLSPPPASRLPKGHPARPKPKRKSYKSKAHQPKPPRSESCIVCTITFQTKTQRTTCSNECHRINKNNKRNARRKVTGRRYDYQRKKAKGLDFDRYTLHEIADRDGWRCQLCGKKIRRNARKRSDRPSVDHIIPLSRGGADILANVALVHFGCNATKGNRVWGDGEQLRLIG